ncbi:hypothetical protein K9M79_08780 [Candidatus Woesearchaeota archaeon]|nr:hypothetical protein [Candidatus Woesearchaeota archaeon]
MMPIFKNRKMYRKGTEKPIEIFVALFIILAVSMVMLKMFQGQIQGKKDELKAIESEDALRQGKEDAKTECRSLCSEASSNECSEKFLARFCIKKVEEIDLNRNLGTSDYDEEFLGGIGICEDGIYCPQVEECTCGKVLDMKECAKLLCSYWQVDQNIPNAEATAMLVKAYNVGSCASAEGYGDGSNMWLQRQFSGTLACTAP